MNLLFKAICEVNQFFVREQIPYVIIGGIAVQYWGEPRFTRDLDITILVALGKEEGALKKILSTFTPRISDAMEFALKNRVCLVKSNDGCEIDISLGIPGYEEEVINRGVEYKIGEDCKAKICSAEDLIIHKSVAGRVQDIADIEGIIIRQGKKLDDKYIANWLRQFSLLLERDEILKRFEKPWNNFIEKGRDS